MAVSTEMYLKLPKVLAALSAEHKMSTPHTSNFMLTDNICEQQCSSLSCDQVCESADVEDIHYLYFALYRSIRQFDAIEGRISELEQRYEHLDRNINILSKNCELMRMRLV